MDRRPAKTSPGFLKVTREQIAIPHAGPGQAGDIGRLTGLEYRVMQCVAYDTRFGGRSRMTNLEIGLAIGMDGPTDQIARRVMRAIAGRKSHGKPLPGLTEKGFLKAFVNTDPRKPWQRELEVTAKWVAPQSVKLADISAEEPTPVPAIASTPVPAIASTPVPEIPELNPPPTDEQRAEVFGRLPRVLTRPELAHRLAAKLRARGLVLELAEGAIKVLRPDASIDPLSPAEAAALKWLRQEVIAELTPPPAPEPTAPEAPTAAPRVANPAEIRSLIGQLSLAGPAGETAREAFADRLTEAFAESDPERSRQTYLGIAQAVGRGELAEHVVIDAFEEACKPRKKNRGAAFVAEVRRLVAFHLKGSEAGG